MPGPAPKPLGLRQRRNKASTRARLALGASGVRAPALPTRGCVCGGPVEPPKPTRGKRKRGRPRKPPEPCKTCQNTGILPWHHLTKSWWARLWASPMTPEYIESDLDRLYMAASLVDAYWWGGGTDTKLHGEIRLALAGFGTTPLDRRRLEWELEKPEQPGEEAEASAPPPAMVDPRLIAEPKGLAN